LPGSLRGGSAPSAPGSTFMMHVVSSGGICAHPAAEFVGRGRPHPTNADPPGANNNITRTPACPAKSPQRQRTRISPPRLRTSAFSASSMRRPAVSRGQRGGPSRPPVGTRPGPLFYSHSPRAPRSWGRRCKLGSVRLTLPTLTTASHLRPGRGTQSSGRDLCRGASSFCRRAPSG